MTIALVIKYSELIAVSSYGRAYTRVHTHVHTHTIDVIKFLTKMMLPDRFIEKTRQTSNSRSQSF